MNDEQDEGASLCTCDVCGCEVDASEIDDLGGELHCIACMDEATT